MKKEETEAVSKRSNSIKGASEKGGNRSGCDRGRENHNGECFQERRAVSRMAAPPPQPHDPRVGTRETEKEERGRKFSPRLTLEKHHQHADPSPVNKFPAEQSGPRVELGLDFY